MPGEEELKKNLPQLIILMILIVAGLFVLTKFSWVKCEDVPGWCGFYCKLVGNSRIAMISGKSGIGDPKEFARQIVENTYHVVEDIPPSQLSFGVLKGYDLVIVEKAENLTEKQIEAIEGYMDSGGTILWVGDSGTIGIKGLPEELINENKTNETEMISGSIVQSYWKKTGLSEYLLADYKEKIDVKNVTLLTIVTSHPIMLGLKKELVLKKTKLAVVSENPAGLTKVANLVVNETEYPAILENKYVGRIVYFAFPPEDVGSPTFIMNLMGFLINC